MPLVKGSNGDYFWSYRQSCLQGSFVVTSVHPVSRVVVVPRPNSCVYIPWTNTGNEQKIVCITEGLDGFPVLVRWTKGEAIGSKVGVDAIKPTSLDVMFVSLFDNEGNKKAVVRCPSDAVGSFSCQKLCPGIWWRQVRVINIKQRKNSPRAGPESVEGAVLPIPERSKRERKKRWISSCCEWLIHQLTVFSYKKNSKSNQHMSLKWVFCCFLLASWGSKMLISDHVHLWLWYYKINVATEGQRCVAWNCQSCLCVYGYMLNILTVSSYAFVLFLFTIWCNVEIELVFILKTAACRLWPH